MPVTRQLFSVSVAPDGAFVPTGQLELSTVQELRQMVDEAMAPGRVIVLDLAQLTFMDSSVIHWLVEICDATGHPVVLRNASPVVRRILDIATTVDADSDAWVFDRDRPSPSTVREEFPPDLGRAAPIRTLHAE
jgi:anti-anti-sigma factor